MNSIHADPALVQEVHWALQHLYDPAELRKSPLVGWLALTARRNPPAALEERLRAAIQDLRPAENVPLDSNAWRIYQILQRRFVEQLTQRQVAADLGYSTRQMRRQEGLALETLADLLWQRYGLAAKMKDEQRPRVAAVVSPEQSPPQSSRPEIAPGSEQELQQIRESFPSEIGDLAALLAAALKSIAPLAQATGTRIQLQIPEDRPPVSGQLEPMRQALLSLLTAAVLSAPGGQVRVNAQVHAQELGVELAAEGGETPAAATRVEIAEGLAMAGRLLDLCGGQLTIMYRGGGHAVADPRPEPRPEPVEGPHARFAASVSLPIAPQTTVLVVDDNADALRLLQRYLSGTRYRFLGVRDATQVVPAAEAAAPAAILLDVMLPGVDGWELLGRLREHPQTRDVPVIVCTILPQERVALTLGAAAFLRKPVSREALLAALDQLDLPTASPAPRSD
jgi:CheY-like chemotaxis protein/signal transduction histidine kinase